MNCLALLLVLSLLYGCGGARVGDLPSSPATLQRLAITPPTIQLRAGSAQQFSANVSRPRARASTRGATKLDVDWSVNGIPGGNLSVGTIDGTGRYTAPMTLPNQNLVTIIASNVAKPSVSATARVILSNPIPMLTSVSPNTISTGDFKLTINGSNFVRGAEVLFAGEVLPTSFLSSSHLVAIGTSNQSQVGSVQILVRNPDPGSASSTVAPIIQVIPPPAIQVFVSPSKATVPVNSSQQFSATFQDAANPAMTRPVNGVPGGTATLGDITRTGRYTAPAMLPNADSVMVTATSVAYPGISRTAVIVLQPAALVSSTTDYYVNAETGDDSYDGTSPTHSGGGVGPWLTLRKAGLTATAGATVHVADGTYKVDGTTGSPTSIETRNSGSSNAWITYVSDNKWGAKIINTNTVNGANNIAWVVEGDYQIVKDFDISGGPYAGIFVDGNHVQLIGNHLHDISSTSCISGSFIYVNSPYQYVDTIGNVMHDGGMKPWPSDCVNWHGIYYGGITKGPVQYGQISNNIIYRVSGFGIHFWHKVSHIDVLSNLIFANVHGGIVIGASEGSINDYFNVRNNMVIFNSNMFDNNGGPASLGWGIEQYVNGGTIGSHNTYLHNLVYGNHDLSGRGGNWANQAAGINPSGVISDTVTADPHLMNYQNSPAVPTISRGKIEFSGADYHPTPASPAKNAGDCMSTSPSDIDGTARPQGGACNIGPY